MESGDQEDFAQTSTALRSGRRLTDRILTAVHAACDHGELDVAVELLRIVEALATRRSQEPESSRRRLMEAVVAAHARLWHLRHPRRGED